MEVTNIRARARRGETSFGLVLGMSDPYIIDMAYCAGYQFVRIDCEHVLYDYNTLKTFFNAARHLGLAAQIRVPDLHNISAILALEPAAIVLPDVNSREMAQAAIDAVKFPPLGSRGMNGGTRSVRFGSFSRDEYMKTGNDRLNLVVQIESKEGLEHIDDILSLDGIDMVASGKADLSQALGVPGQKDHPDVIAAENYIIEKAKQYGKILTLSVSTPERLQELKEKGVHCFSIGRDEDLCLKAVRSQLKKMSQADQIPVTRPGEE